MNNAGNGPSSIGLAPIPNFFPWARIKSHVAIQPQFPLYSTSPFPLNHLLDWVSIIPVLLYALLQWLIKNISRRAQLATARLAHHQGTQTPVFRFRFLRRLQPEHSFISLSTIHSPLLTSCPQPKLWTLYPATPPTPSLRTRSRSRFSTSYSPLSACQRPPIRLAVLRATLLPSLMATSKSMTHLQSE